MRERGGRKEGRERVREGGGKEGREGEKRDGGKEAREEGGREEGGGRGGEALEFYISAKSLSEMKLIF